MECSEIYRIGKRKCFIHILFKHALLMAFLSLLYIAYIRDTINSLGASCDEAPYTIILTVSGLILAGAISGFFQFTYKDIQDRYHLFVGHLTTFLELTVIGSLLLVSIACMKSYIATAKLGNLPFLISLVLYGSLVLYDIYDLMKLTVKK